MVAKIYISGKIERGETLKDVIRQFKSYEDPTSIEVDINSIGGSVKEGDDTYDYLKNLDSEYPVTTRTSKAYSIAAKIFAAGSTRIVEDVDEALMIHFPWAKPENGGGADYFEGLAEELREIESEFTNFYSEFLDIDSVTMGNLLENETMISGQEALDYNFATEIESKSEAIAEFNKVDNSKNNKMSKEKKGLNKILALMQDFIKGAEEKPEAKAELILQDSNGDEIIFPDLEEDGVPSVGDKATMGGSAIEDGSYIMPSLEEATVKFEGGEIVEIIEKVVEEETTEETAEETTEAQAANKNDEMPEVNAEEVKQVSVWTMEVTNTSFAEGDTVKYKDWEDNEVSVGAGEYQLNDGRRVITDASGVIVSIKEAVTPKEVEIDNENPEASFKDMLSKMETKIKADISAEFEEKITAKNQEIETLKAGRESREINAGQRTPKGNLQEKRRSNAARILNAAKQ